VDEWIQNNTYNEEIFNPTDAELDEYEIKEWSANQLRTHLFAVRAECHAVIENWNSAYNDQKAAINFVTKDMGEESLEEWELLSLTLSLTLTLTEGICGVRCLSAQSHALHQTKR